MHLSSKDQRSDNLDYFKPEIRQDIRSACSPKKRKKERFGVVSMYENAS